MVSIFSVLKSCECILTKTLKKRTSRKRLSRAQNLSKTAQINLFGCNQITFGESLEFWCSKKRPLADTRFAYLALCCNGRKLPFMKSGTKYRWHSNRPVFLQKWVDLSRFLWCNCACGTWQCHLMSVLFFSLHFAIKCVKKWELHQKKRVLSSFLH